MRNTYDVAVGILILLSFRILRLFHDRTEVVLSPHTIRGKARYRLLVHFMNTLSSAFPTISPRLMESDIDPVVILAMLPTELKLLIKTFTSIFQMQDAFLTNDLEEMARLVC